MEISKIKYSIYNNPGKDIPITGISNTANWTHPSKIDIPLKSFKANYLCSFGSFDNLKNIIKCTQDIKNDFYIKKNILMDTDLDSFSQSIQENIKNPKNSNTQDLIKVLAPISQIKDDDLLEYSKEKFDSYYSFTAYAKMLVQKEYIQEILFKLDNTPPNKKLNKDELDELFSSAAKKINKLHDANTQNEEIKNLLQYSNDTSCDNIEKIKLTQNEISILRNKIENYSKSDTTKELLSQLIDEHVQGSKLLRHGVGHRIQLAALQTCPRYDVSKDTRDNTIFEKHPLTRWLGIYPIDNINYTLEKFKPLETYSYFNMQCCSKKMDFAEKSTAYRDDFVGANMKFIIHPKSDITKAYDIGLREYGDREVIYPAFTLFNILDKRLVKQKSNEGEFYRWVIHMQEK